MTRLILGFIPLVDCAPLAVAHEHGFAAREGLELTLVRETSWANIRDRLLIGHFDAAHMLGPMVVASTLGIRHVKVPLAAPIALGLGGNAITVSRPLWESMHREGAMLGGDPARLGRALERVVRGRARRGETPLTLGTVYPFSCHNYELRYWLAAVGIDPDRDVRLVVIPPPFLVDALRAGQIDGFCVGEPWNSAAVEAGAGVIVTSTSAIWPDSPEKVLGCRADWADGHPEALAALIRSLHRAARWCERLDNHAGLATLLAEPRYVGASASIVSRALAGRLALERDAPEAVYPGFYSVSSPHATFPWVSHAQWFYAQMVRWRQIEPASERAAEAASTYRPDLYRAALAPLGIEAPSSNLKGETFFDGVRFDPERTDVSAEEAAPQV